MSFEMLREGESDMIDRETIYLSRHDLTPIAWKADIYCAHCDESFEIDFCFEDSTGDCPHCGKAFDIIVD